MTENMTYASTGVDYGAMDPFKRQALAAGLETAPNIERFGFYEISMSRGESAYLVEMPQVILAHVEEGLGTKNIVADQMSALTGKSYYDQVAQCTMAMIINDIITLGAMPVSVMMHLAVGESSWFGNQQRSIDLINGWKKACMLSGCVWGGGETPTLKDIIIPGKSVISGSATGIIEPKSRLITENKIQHGDVIILLGSSGIHANGLTLARSIGDRKDGFWRKFSNLILPQSFPLHALPKGYLTELSDGRTYGETLLTPTCIYQKFMEECQKWGVDIHYAVNITGHGWRKLMRANRNFRYIIEELPKEQPIFAFLQKHGPISDEEAFGNLNMGAGFAIYISKADVSKAMMIAQDYNFDAIKAGYIKRSVDKRVVILPKYLEFKGESLNIR